MPITVDTILLARAVLDLVADAGHAAAAAYIRHQEQGDKPVTVEEIDAMISNHKPTREILAEMGIYL